VPSKSPGIGNELAIKIRMAAGSVQGVAADGDASDAMVTPLPFEQGHARL
jgi:hypothetical protein